MTTIGWTADLCQGRGAALLLLAAALLTGCASDPDPAAEARRKREQEKLAVRPRRASESIDGYDGRPLVKRVQNGEPQPGLTVGSGRRIVLVAMVPDRSKSSRRVVARTGKAGSGPEVSKMDRHSRGLPKKPRAFVITDGSAREFVKEQRKKETMPAGQVKPFAPQFFEGILEDLRTLGLERLVPVSSRKNERIPGEAGIHLQLDLGRQSYFLRFQKSVADGTPPILEYTRCATYLQLCFDDTMSRQGRMTFVKKKVASGERKRGG